jgi:phytanoyl-CoA dioxygenase PhyH
MVIDARFTRFAAQLDRDGFFVWPGLLPADLIDQHVAEYLELNLRLEAPPGEDFHAYSPAKQAALKTARYDFHRDNPATQRMIFNARLIEFLRARFGEDPVMRQPETGFYTRRTPAHTDALDFKVSPAGREVRVWCALEDIHPDAGPVYFIPGSHRTISAYLEREVLTEFPEFADLLRSQMGPTSAPEFFLATRPLWNYVKQRKLPTAIHAGGVAPQPLLLKKGDAVIFASDVVHGTCPCKDPRRTRAYFVAFWSAVGAVWYHSRSYWGPLHDHRHAENALAAPVERTPLGLRISFQTLHTNYLASFARAVAVAVEKEAREVLQCRR